MKSEFYIAGIMPGYALALLFDMLVTYRLFRGRLCRGHESFTDDVHQRVHELDNWHMELNVTVTELATAWRDVFPCDTIAHPSPVDHVAHSVALCEGLGRSRASLVAILAGHELKAGEVLAAAGGVWTGPVELLALMNACTIPTTTSNSTTQGRITLLY